jgi:hypothetical protein
MIWNYHASARRAPAATNREVAQQLRDRASSTRERSERLRSRTETLCTGLATKVDRGWLWLEMMRSDLEWRAVVESEAREAHESAHAESWLRERILELIAEAEAGDESALMGVDVALLAQTGLTRLAERFSPPRM